jgi:hypothetical protein
LANIGPAVLPDPATPVTPSEAAAIPVATPRNTRRIGPCI